MLQALFRVTADRDTGLVNYDIWKRKFTVRNFVKRPCDDDVQ